VAKSKIAGFGDRLYLGRGGIVGQEGEIGVAVVGSGGERDFVRALILHEVTPPLSCCQFLFQVTQAQLCGGGLRRCGDCGGVEGGLCPFPQ